jgi:imidazolonepropionase-like amidohydrolase
VRSIRRLAAAAARSVVALLVGALGGSVVAAAEPDTSLAAVDAAPRTASAAPAPVLFRRVAVVPMTANRVDADRDVLVVAGRIARIAAGGTLRAPRGATEVDGRGRFLMPGLAEMHAHVPSPPPGAESDSRAAIDARRYADDVLFLYVAHGLTTIRGMLGHPWHLELRDGIARGTTLGPRLYTASPSLNGTSAPDVATAERRVREHAAAGYDFLKLHPGLTREVFDAIATTASELRIPFEGHVSDDVGVERALAARQRAIDHFDGYVQALVDPACVAGPTSAGFFGIGLVHCVDERRIPALVAQTLAAGTWMAPTQSLLERWALPPSPGALAADPALRYVPPTVRAQWQKARDGFLALQSVGDERARRFVEVRRTLLREMHRAGVPVLLASDAPQVFNVPGDSAHVELELYVAAGLSNYDALRTGTVNAARFFGAQERRGTVEPGRDADLVLLAANPLEDVRAARRIEGVMLAGRWLPRAELAAGLAAIAARNAAQASSAGTAPAATAASAMPTAVPPAASTAVPTAASPAAPQPSRLAAAP